MFSKEHWVPVGTDKPCVGCGECCRQLPCSFAKVENGRCTQLQHRDGRYWCGNEEAVASNVLLIGWGCGATHIPKVFVNRKKQTNAAH